MNKSFVFLGRHKEVKQLRTLHELRRHVLIVGRAGIGKTALMQHVRELSSILICDDSSSLGRICGSLIAEPVAATLRWLEQTRDALTQAMDVIASSCGRDAPEELPKPTGMPMLDVSEISRTIVIEKPRMLSLLGKGVLASHVRRKLGADYDRALLEFLSLYSNRLRRWMEQSINAMRNAFAAFADMHRAHFEAAPAVGGTADVSAVETDLRLLRQWKAQDSSRETPADRKLSVEYTNQIQRGN